ncbi:MAG: hydrogenase formation protein HypD [Lachnospiraceae bacterium]|nr:hydrogenase formation protein HypD [Lachnospiraceae bacterium]
MRSIREAVDYLRQYDGPVIRLMEVCGTHTAQIAESGIPAMLSERIRLISGPGCPVCVTVTAFIDRLIDLARTEGVTVLTFGDLMRVPGSAESLADAKSTGASVDFVYAPAEILARAQAQPDRRFVFAAIGFETTAPVYAMLMEEAIERGVKNVRLLTSLKTMPKAISRVAGMAAQAGRPLDGFLAPGHVCAVVGMSDYERLAGQLSLPFVISGFQGPELVASIYALVKMRGQAAVRNLYPSVVQKEGNEKARAAIDRFFTPCDAGWRGMGVIPDSGLRIREEYASFDAGSERLTEDRAPEGCRCGEVLTGSIAPPECPFFGGGCTPGHPHGACMVSPEGSCHTWFNNNPRTP